MSKELFTDTEALMTQRTLERGISPSLSFKRLLWLRGPMMITVALAIGVPAAILGWFLTPAEYTATADLRFLAATPRVMASEAQREASVPYEKFVNTQLGLITGNPIVSRVLDVPEVKGLPCLERARGDKLSYVKKRIQARNDRNSELVRVTCTLPDRDAALRVLEEMISVYMEYALSAEAAAGGERMVVLQKEREQRQKELEDQLAKISQMQSSLGIAIVGENPLETGEGDLYRKNYFAADEQLNRVSRECAQLQSQVDRLSGTGATGDAVVDNLVEDRVNSDGLTNSLRRDLAVAEIELAAAMEKLAPGAKLLERQQARLETLKKSVAEAEKKARARAIETVRVDYNTKLALVTKEKEEAAAKLERFKAQLDDYTARVKTATDRFAELEELKKKAAETRVNLQSVRDEITKISLESKAPARVQAASQPNVPEGGPDYSMRLMVVFLALLLSASVGFGSGLWRELMDHQIRTPQDLLRVTTLPVVAAVPSIREDNLPADTNVALLAMEHPNARSVDEYRRVLAHLLYPEDTTMELKSLLVASPMRGDGKTSLATNLALTLVQAGRRVLLVDISFRRPNIEQVFGLSRDIGLAEILQGTATLEDTVRATDYGNLGILGPGQETHGLGSRLASREMAAFLEEASKHFDHTILDTAPSLVMSDARLVAPLVDGVVLVVGAGVSTLGMVQRCVRDMQQVDANLIGLVLNGVRSTPGGYMRRNVELYYAYGHDGRPSAEPKDDKETQDA